mgnify:CR=1 FL=1
MLTKLTLSLTFKHDNYHVYKKDFKIDTLAWKDAFLVLGGIVLVLSFTALFIRFSKAENDAANKEIAEIKKFEKTIEDTEEELEPAMELN